MGSPFGINPDERTYFFIEGANFYALVKNSNITIDYKRILQHFKNESLFVRGSYYTALADDQEFSSIKPLIDYLDYNGYKVVTKPIREYTDATGRRKIKGSLDVEMTIDMLRAADPRHGRADHIVLFSGDSDFIPVVKELQRMGARVTVVSGKGYVSDELRREADNYANVVEDPALRETIMKLEDEATVTRAPRTTRPLGVTRPMVRA